MEIRSLSKRKHSKCKYKFQLGFTGYEYLISVLYECVLSRSYQDTAIFLLRGQNRNQLRFRKVLLMSLKTSSCSLIYYICFPSAGFLKNVFCQIQNCIRLCRDMFSHVYSIFWNTYMFLKKRKLSKCNF
jgi:hypothetical protein